VEPRLDERDSSINEALALTYNRLYIVVLTAMVFAAFN